MTHGAGGTGWSYNDTSKTLTISTNVTVTGTASDIEVQITGGTVTWDNAILTKNTYGSVIGLYGGSLNMTGGKVEHTRNDEHAIDNGGSGTITISGGTVSATSGMAIWNKSTGGITISGTAIITSGRTNTSEGTILLQGNGALNITGGTVQNTASGNAIYNGTGTVTISGGEIDGEIDGAGSTTINGGKINGVSMCGTCVAKADDCATCKNCYDPITPPQHTAPADWNSGNAATCMAASTRKKLCTVCDEVLDSETQGALGHTEGAVATCIAAQTCIRCPHEFAAALGHTTTTPGETCTRCNTTIPGGSPSTNGGTSGFTNPDMTPFYGVTKSAPDPKPETTTPKDAPADWAAAAVKKATELKLVPARLQGDWTADLSRADFCALAVKLYEYLDGKPIEARGYFDDTTDVNVQKLAGLGIVTGGGNGKFDPNGAFTREMALTLIYNMMVQLGHAFEPAEPSFADASDISPWAKTAIGALQKAGVVEGDGQYFNPSQVFTREMGVVTVMNILGVSR